MSGAFSSSSGLKRTDTLWKAPGKAAVLRAQMAADRRIFRLVLLTTDVPTAGSAGGGP